MLEVGKKEVDKEELLVRRILTLMRKIKLCCELLANVGGVWLDCNEESGRERFKRI